MQPNGVYSIDGSIVMYYIIDYEWQYVMETGGPVYVAQWRQVGQQWIECNRDGQAGKWGISDR
jgi:hypothetical protein